MSSNAVYSEISELPDAEKALHDVLQTISKEHGYKDCNTLIKPFSTGGANYTSQLYHITLSASCKEDLRLFAKVACVNESIRAQIALQVYDREMFFYTRLLKRFKELEERHNVPLQHRLATVKYFGSCEDYLKEVLILENLSHAGLQIQDRLKSFDWEYASKSVTEMAKLHALSVALFEENPDEVNALSERLNIDMFMNQVWEMMHRMIDGVLEVIVEENKGKIESFMRRIQALEVDHFFKSRRIPVIAHGDFRQSNLMHRRREDGEFEVYVLDYQTLRVSNPISDLMFFIFSGSDGKFREKYYHQLLDHYYTELCNALTRLGVKAEKVYSREDFDYEIKELQPYGLLMGLVVMPMITIETENAPDLSESTGFEDVMVKPNILATVRVNELVNDFIKLGVL